MTEISAWMPLYIGDYLADTMHLTAAEHGAYLLLIMHYWRSGPLPDDDRTLAAIARTERKEWSQISGTVRQFFQAESGRLRHKRIDREMSAAGTHVEQRRAAGKASAEARRRQREANEKPNENTTAVGTDAPTGGQRKGRPSPSPSPEVAKPATSVTELARVNGKNPPNPCLNDPPEAWMPLANWECEVVNGPSGPVKRAVAGGFYLDDAARLVTEAAGINDANWRGDWRPLVAWLHDKLDLHDAILPAIKRVAERPGYAVPRSLAYFDAAVREGKAAA